MKTIEIKGELGTSSIIVGESLKNLDKYIPNNSGVIVVTDKNIFSLYSKEFDPYREKLIILETGEANKNLSTVEFIYRKFLEFEADRHTFVVGVGGGIVCDITGFAASTYMRGLNFGFVSTTLLSQVDASVGGKNGVNFLGFKNMVGVFNPPQFVLCSIDMLKTLSYKEYSNGIAEMVKHGVINSIEHFKEIERFKEDLKSCNNINLLENLIYNSIKIKSSIVEKDQRESGERKKLNFGHTYGHAIEHCEKISHGKAVSIGIIIGLRVSLKLGLIVEDDIKRVSSLLKFFNLPLESSCKMENLQKIIFKDKKRSGKSIDFVAVDGFLGRSKVVKLSFQCLKEMFK
ncbi:MAG: 3-dehydroquinate synthase [Candidatus Cloacimonadota bacterium]|nr:MAG: 3-dehydroquinate synthase [Candidatus Cloacimonadota bacterium]PIE81103.1 MAG: 3-dehydroquinate synthase [Candidatus Delongbacteria bacterium]